MRNILTGAKQVAESVYDWLSKEGETTYRARVNSSKELAGYLPKELDHIYYRYL